MRSDLLTPIDYILLAFSCFFVILGAIRGASGIFSFLVGIVFSCAAVIFLWPTLESFVVQQPVRYLVACVGALLFFGGVRVIVRKVVNDILDQPADMIFGIVSGVVIAVLMFYISVNISTVRENSFIVHEMYEVIEGSDDVR